MNTDELGKLLDQKLQPINQRLDKLVTDLAFRKRYDHRQSDDGR